MECFEKYINNRGKILSNNGKSIIKMIEGPMTLLQKCLFLRILMVSDAAVVEELEAIGLRDIIYVWFEAATAAEDVYFLHLLLDTFDRLPHSLIRDFNEQTRKLCNLNNPELTVKAKNLVMKWRKEDKLILEKQKFTYITLDKSSTVKRIASQYRSLGDEDEVINNNDATISVACEESKVIMEELSKGAAEVTKVIHDEVVILPMITELSESITHDEDLEKIAKLSNKIKKIKRVSWASNGNLKTIIPIDYGFEDDSHDQTTSPLSNGLQEFSTLSSSPTFENNRLNSKKGSFMKKAHLNATEERKLALSHKLFGVLVAGRSDINISSLTCSDVYKILKPEESDLKHKGIVLFPPK